MDNEEKERHSRESGSRSEAETGEANPAYFSPP